MLVPVVPALYEDRGQLFTFTEEHTRIDLKVRPTSQATLLGYPYGFFDTRNFLPVWKTGHLATEPSVDFQGEPVFLVDVSAFPGMSGAPVVGVSNGVYESESGAMLTGVQRRLLGIFSAMRMVRSRSTEAGAGQTVSVHYTGWLFDGIKADKRGSKFDSSKDHGEPFEFNLGARQVITGWDQGVAGMKVGGTRVLTIPPQLGYGARGAGGVIPPNATLVFEVELLDVK